MIYEMRTYTLQPGKVAEFEERFAQRQPAREKHSKLGAFFHTDFGPLNQVIHIWPYENLQHRTEVRAAMASDPELQRTAGGGGAIVQQESEICIPAPFMRPLGGDQELGNFYEMRQYTFLPGAMPALLEAWGAAMPQREEFSPLAAGMYTELGGLNKWIHIWPYKTMEDRDRVREQSRAAGVWPPQGDFRASMIKQENKLLIPAAFSPMH
ncbi:MAG: NIPSNAP family protein [Dehalococcoidia bacterium]